jgi:hypothetical protein
LLYGAKSINACERKQSQREINGDQRWSAAAWWSGGWQRRVWSGCASQTPRQAIAEKGATVEVDLL